MSATNGTNAGPYPQRFQFTHYPSAFSPGEDYLAEILELSPSRLLVILDDTTVSGRHPIDENELPEIASRVWRKRLYHHDPEMIFWAIRLHSDEAPAAEGSESSDQEPSYQRLDLFWDGERYSRAERRVMFNRAAFQAAFPATSEKRAAS